MHVPSWGQGGCHRAGRVTHQSNDTRARVLQDLWLSLRKMRKQGRTEVCLWLSDQGSQAG